MIFTLFYILMLIAYVPTRAFAALNSVLILLIVFFGLLVTLIKPSKKIFTIPDKILLYLTLFLSIALGIIFRIPLYQILPSARLINVSLQSIALVLVLVFLICKSYKLSNYFNEVNFFKILIFIGLIQRVLLLCTSPNPSIDSFVEMKEAPQKLWLEGKNPYQTDLSQIYKGSAPNPYNYLPGTLFLLAPFSILFNEPRILYFISDLCFAILIYYLSYKSIAKALTLVYFYNPVSLFILESSWMEPLVLMLLGLYILFIKQKRNAFAGLTMSIFLSLKQNLITFPIFMIKSGLASLKVIFIAIVFFFVIVGPFIIWSPKKFYEEVFLFFDRQGYAPFTHGVTVGRLFQESLHIKIPEATIFISPIIFSLISFIFVKKEIKSSLLGFTISQFSFFLFGSIGYINYYYFVSIMILSLAGIKNLKYRNHNNL